MAKVGDGVFWIDAEGLPLGTADSRPKKKKKRRDDLLRKRGSMYKSITENTPRDVVFLFMSCYKQNIKVSLAVIDVIGYWPGD